MHKKLSAILISIGIICLLYAIFGRYLVLPGYLEGLDQGTGTLEGAVQTVSPWKVVRYLIWAYSFKLGIYFILLGAVMRTEMSKSRKWTVGIGGFLYIGFAYMPLPVPNSIIYGIAGGLMTVFILVIILRWADQRSQLPSEKRAASDFRMAGIFFFGMATYTLCPLLGVKTFALSPEKMIQYGLQGEAASFSFHLLIELVLGWFFTFLGFRQPKRRRFS